MGEKNKKSQLNSERTEFEDSKEFFGFVLKQCRRGIKAEDQYEYSIGRTILRRMNLKDVFCDAKERLKRSYERFSRKDQEKTNKKGEKIIIKKKVGSCWDLAMAMDYQLLLDEEKDHHIVAVPLPGGCAPHTFNLLVKDGELILIDLLMSADGRARPVGNYEKFKYLVNLIYGEDNDWANFQNWYVMDQVTGAPKEGRLAYKKWTKFCGKTENDGGFMIIDPGKGVFKVNPNVKYNISSFKRLFLLWG